MRPRTQPAGVVVGKELRLHGGHVHLDRAVLLAALAGQAQVQRVADLGGPPARGDRRVGVPFQHLEQQPAPAAGGVLLLAGDHVGRAHHPPAAVPALADAHAPHHRALEPAVVVGIAEVAVVVSRSPGGAEPQVLVDPVGRDHLARVHQVVRVEDRLELPEGPHQVIAEHLGQQLAARLAVAVLPGERAAVRHHQVRGTLDEPAELRDAVDRDQVERDPGVHAAVAEMSVKGRARVAELVVELGSDPAGSPPAVRAGPPSLPSLPRCRACQGPGRWRRVPPRGRRRAPSRVPGRRRTGPSARARCRADRRSGSAPWHRPRPANLRRR